jgi:protein gp37
MGQGTNIAWCDDTWNPWRGCTKVSAGCANCYAEKLVTGRMQGQPYRKGIPRVRHATWTFNAPLGWNKNPWICDACGQAYKTDGVTPSGDLCFNHRGVWPPRHRRRVFSLSLGDWLDDEVPIGWLADMLDVVRRCPELDFLLLTKRPALWRDRLTGVMNYSACGETASWLSWWLDTSGDAIAPGNIWLGVSVEDQATVDERIPQLLEIPAAVRFVSYEPALGAVSFQQSAFSHPEKQIDWMIVGGESGSMARPFNVAWARYSIKQCEAAGAACFVKQLGSAPIVDREDAQIIRDRKGGDPAEWPEDLRVWQWPVSARRADATNTVRP